MKNAKYKFKDSLPIVPHGISQMILLQFDRIMINSMIGASAAGIYGFSYSIYSIISITGTSIDHAFAPWFYEKMENKEYSDIKKYSKDISFGMLLLSIIAILFAPEAIKILGSEDYWEGVYTAIPLVVAGYFSFMYLIPCKARRREEEPSTGGTERILRHGYSALPGSGRGAVQQHTAETTQADRFIGSSGQGAVCTGLQQFR